jgi:hypothetical protein
MEPEPASFGESCALDDCFWRQDQAGNESPPSRKARTEGTHSAEFAKAAFPVLRKKSPKTKGAMYKFVRNLVAGGLSLRIRRGFRGLPVLRRLRGVFLTVAALLLLGSAFRQIRGRLLAAFFVLFVEMF